MSKKRRAEHAVLGANETCHLWSSKYAAQGGTKVNHLNSRLKVIGARNPKGKIGVALFQQAAGFPEDTSKAIRAQDVDIDTNTMSAQVVFGDLPEGVYAISVRHDENSNGKLDKNFVGIPKEGYGASNNAAKKRRAPKFDEATFLLNGTGQTIEIKLIY
jgi:uncharacterized protein (DUF2141 family)